MDYSKRTNIINPNVVLEIMLGSPNILWLILDGLRSYKTGRAGYNHGITSQHKRISFKRTNHCLTNYISLSENASLSTSSKLTEMQSSHLNQETPQVYEKYKEYRQYLYQSSCHDQINICLKNLEYQCKGRNDVTELCKSKNEDNHISIDDPETKKKIDEILINRLGKYGNPISSIEAKKSSHIPCINNHHT